MVGATASVRHIGLSVTSGQCIIADMRRQDPAVLAPYLDHLRSLPFVREVEVRPADAGDRAGGDELALRTARRTVLFDVRVKQTFLDHALTNVLMAEHQAAHERRPMLLFARYVPQQTGERLADAGVNFVDRLGNMHLALGNDHHVLRLGRREPKPAVTARRPGPALVQLYFVLLTEPAAATWPVRRIADEAGIGKTAAATGLQRLVHLGVLAEDHDQRYRLVDRTRLIDAFLQGYTNVLRPYLEVGRFRAAERDQEAFLAQLASTASEMHMTWAVTGAPAAYTLDRFYRGDEVPLFVHGFTPAVQRALRLLPDRDGPITLLEAFGRRWAWKTLGERPLAHPWLVYAELLYRDEPRSLEAAEHIRVQFLTAAA